MLREFLLHNLYNKVLTCSGMKVTGFVSSYHGLLRSRGIHRAPASPRTSVFQNQHKVEKVYESDNFLLVNKPYNMYVYSSNFAEINTVAAQIAKPDSYCSSSTDHIHFVHRLDYATSGVLCLAKNNRAASKAGRAMEKRLARKYYLAVVRGTVEQCCDILYDIGRNKTPDAYHKMVAVTDQATEYTSKNKVSAHTRLMPLETGLYDGQDVTIVLLKPVTGRRHQLRVHCWYIGHPIVGDVEYSGGMDRSPHRMYLHAARLILPIPSEPIDVQSSTPFTNDEKFLQKYIKTQVYHKYTSREDFITACSYIDNIKSDCIKKYEYLYKSQKK